MGNLPRSFNSVENRVIADILDIQTLSFVFSLLDIAKPWKMKL